ncbi:hypothetical protein DIPPA_07154 [Diplonema papillatum]|nr:hypothetical protein DIPPA_07154 [Diplonema papillatum]|eukprot:gene3316-5198_t
MRILFVVACGCALGSQTAASEGTVLPMTHAYAPGWSGKAGEHAGIVAFSELCSKKRNCHTFDGTRAVVKCPQWPSIDGQQAWIEETAGWFVLWRDSSHTSPLLPSASDYQRVKDDEIGYLRDKVALTLYR